MFNIVLNAAKRYDACGKVGLQGKSTPPTSWGGRILLTFGKSRQRNMLGSGCWSESDSKKIPRSVIVSVPACPVIENLSMYGSGT